MDLHTLVTRIQNIGLAAVIVAHSIPEGCQGAGAKWLSIVVKDPSGRDREYDREFQLFNGASMSSDETTEVTLGVLAAKRKDYNEKENTVA